MMNLEVFLEFGPILTKLLFFIIWNSCWTKFAHQKIERGGIRIFEIVDGSKNLARYQV